MGAQYGQGYLFRKPFPLADMTVRPAEQLLRAGSGTSVL
jgi:hypothetical protein